MVNKDIKKLYYSIGEVSELTKVEPHVLRFWEKEFTILRPKRGRSGNRTYRERDLKLILVIKGLLYEQKYTISGASEQLKNDKSLLENRKITPHSDTVFVPSEGDILSELRVMLEELKSLVQGEVKHE